MTGARAVRSNGQLDEESSPSGAGSIAPPAVEADSRIAADAVEMDGARISELRVLRC